MKKMLLLVCALSAAALAFADIHDFRLGIRGGANVAMAESYLFYGEEGDESLIKSYSNDFGSLGAVLNADIGVASWLAVSPELEFGYQRTKTNSLYIDREYEYIGDDLYAEWIDVTVDVLFKVRSKKLVYFGVGPALHVNTAPTFKDSGTSETGTASYSFAIVGDAGLTLPIGRGWVVISARTMFSPMENASYDLVQKYVDDESVSFDDVSDLDKTALVPFKLGFYLGYSLLIK